MWARHVRRCRLASVFLLRETRDSLYHWHSCNRHFCYRGYNPFHIIVLIVTAFWSLWDHLYPSARLVRVPFSPARATSSFISGINKLIYFSVRYLCGAFLEARASDWFFLLQSPRFIHNFTTVIILFKVSARAFFEVSVPLNFCIWHEIKST